MAKPATKETAAETAAIPPQGLPVPEGAVKNEPLPTKVDAKYASVQKFQGSLRPHDFQFTGKLYTIQPDDDVTLDDICNPAYWANVSNELTGGENLWIELGGTDPRFVWARVIEAGHLWAKIKLIVNTSLKDEQQEAIGLRRAYGNNDYVVEYKGGISKWCVRRISDNVILHKGCTGQSDAQFWLTEYQKSFRK